MHSSNHAIAMFFKLRDMPKLLHCLAVPASARDHAVVWASSAPVQELHAVIKAEQTLRLDAVYVVAYVEQLATVQKVGYASR